MAQSYRDLLKGHAYTTVTVNATAIDEGIFPPEDDAEALKKQALGEIKELIASGECDFIKIEEAEE